LLEVGGPLGLLLLQLEPVDDGPGVGQVLDDRLLRVPAALEAGELLVALGRSISSWPMRRRTSSTSVGIESISMRSRLAASSTRSMALSGRKRSAM
jgi:hypothetical protein